MFQLTTEPVRIVNAVKRFDSVVAVDHVSLDIPQGEFFTLLGPSGCGKTTLLRLIAGLETPTSGQIFLGDRDITNEAPNRRDTIMVFQSYALFPHMTVAENVGYGLRLARKPKKQIKEDVEQVLELMGMPGLGGRYIGQLSGGQQQRVALARAVVLKPKVLLFDEPLSNLDAKLRKRMRLELRALQRELNITSIYVTHDQLEALAMSDRIVVMRDGVAEQVGTPRDIYEQPATDFVADFIGEANLLPAVVTAVNGDTASIAVDGETLQLSQSGLSVGQKGSLVIRPEAVQINPDERGEAEAEITEATFLGSYVEYELMFGERPIKAIDYFQTEAVEKPGATVPIRFESKGLHFIVK